MNKFIKHIIQESEENEEEDIDSFFKPKNISSREEKLKKELFQIVNYWGNPIDILNEDNILDIFSNIEIKVNKPEIFMFSFNENVTSSNIGIIRDLLFPNSSSGILLTSRHYDTYYTFTKGKLKNEIEKNFSSTFINFKLEVDDDGKIANIIGINGSVVNLASKRIADEWATYNEASQQDKEIAEQGLQTWMQNKEAKIRKSFIDLFMPYCE